MGTEPVSVWLVSNGKYWRAAWRDAEGRTQSRGLGSKAKVSRREAGVLCRRLAAELTEAPPAGREAAAVPRLSEWLERYAGQRADVADKTRATYRSCFVYLRLYFNADPTIDRIGRADAAAWRAAVASGELTDRLNLLAVMDPEHYRNPASGRAWVRPAAATVALHTRVAKLVFRAAVDQDLIAANPFDRLRGTAPRSRRDWRDVTRADLSRILDACPNGPWRAMFALCRLAGLRLGEARRLTWADVDWKGNRLRVNSDVKIDTTKRRPRVCPIEPAKLPTGLTRILLDAREAAAPGSAGPCDGVLANNLYVRAATVLRRAGVGEYPKPFHSLRKCWETELAGVYPQHVVCEWLGHGITVSAEHYLRVPEEMYAPPPAATAVQYPIGRQPTEDGRPADAPSPPRNPNETGDVRT